MPIAPAQPCKALGVEIPPQFAQFDQQAFWRLEREGEAFHIHHGVGKTALYQHIAPIVHVDKRMGRRWPAEAAVNFSQFQQRIGPEAGKHQKTIGAQPLQPLGNQPLRVGFTMQRHIRPEHIRCRNRAIKLGEMLFRAQQTFPPRKRHVRLCGVRLCGARMQNVALGFGVALRQRSVNLHTAVQRVPVNPMGGLELDERQPFFHAPRHFFVQPRRLRRHAQSPALGGDGVDEGIACRGQFGRGEHVPEYIGRMFRRFGFRFLPSQCTVCHTWPAQPVCAACQDTFTPLPKELTRCPTCALAIPHDTAQCLVCSVEPPPWDAAFCAVSYAYPWVELIADFKFREHPAWAHYFADRLRANPAVQAALEAADCLIPMPLSPQRLQERGYNQALLLAQALHRRKAKADILLRVGATALQHTLSRAERWQNLQHAFIVHPIHRQTISQQRVVLVDDVMTTGASLHAAAHALHRAGVTAITVLVIARTEVQ